MDGVIIERIPINRWQRKKVGFQFGMYVWISIAEKNNVTFEDMGGLDPTVVAQDTLFFAADWYAYNNRLPRPKREMIVKAMDYMSVPQMERIRKCMEQSRIGGKSIMNLMSEADKKKQVPKK